MKKILFVIGSLHRDSFNRILLKRPPLLLATVQRWLIWTMQAYLTDEQRQGIGSAGRLCLPD